MKRDKRVNVTTNPTMVRELLRFSRDLETQKTGGKPFYPFSKKTGNMALGQTYGGPRVYGRPFQP